MVPLSPKAGHKHLPGKKACELAPWGAAWTGHSDRSSISFSAHTFLNSSAASDLRVFRTAWLHLVAAPPPTTPATGQPVACAQSEGQPPLRHGQGRPPSNALPPPHGVICTSSGDNRRSCGKKEKDCGSHSTQSAGRTRKSERLLGRRPLQPVRRPHFAHLRPMPSEAQV